MRESNESNGSGTPIDDASRPLAVCDGGTAADPWDLTSTALYDRLHERAAEGVATVVVTVVAVEGSGYRRPGARTALTADGRALGATATTVDSVPNDPLADLAREVSETDTPRVETFDLTADDEARGFGLGCNGVVTFLVEPLERSWHDALAVRARGEPVVLATAVGGDHPAVEVGDRLLVDADGTVLEGGRPGDGRRQAADDRRLVGALAAHLGDAVRPALDVALGGSSWVETAALDGGTVDLFVDALTPPPTLLVFGGWGDVDPIARFARDVGFRVTVAVPEGTGATVSTVPAADRVVAVSPSELGDVVDATERTYAALVSHSFDADRRALASLLGLAPPLPYVGVMGPRDRFDDLLAALADEGVELDAAGLERTASPVGLDLGADEPAQVAMSVVAEALAVANGRDGGRLSAGENPVHPR